VGQISGIVLAGPREDQARRYRGNGQNADTQGADNYLLTTGSRVPQVAGVRPAALVRRSRASRSSDSEPLSE
jgi:hypothetical protein